MGVSVHCTQNTATSTSWRVPEINRNTWVRIQKIQYYSLKAHFVIYLLICIGLLYLCPEYLLCLAKQCTLYLAGWARSNVYPFYSAAREIEANGRPTEEGIQKVRNGEGVETSNGIESDERV